MKKSIGLAILMGCIFQAAVSGQGYQALHGSAFTGSTAVFNNPASPVNSAYAWDLTLFSAQVKMTTNSAYLKNFSFRHPSNGELTLKEGMSTKFFHMGADMSLFNFLYKIDDKKALNFGLRFRSYTHVKTSAFQFSDTLSSLNSFFKLNNRLAYLDGFATSSGWAEADLNYSQVLSENASARLTGGVTLQIMKGLAGVFARANKISYLEAKTGTDTSYSFTNGNGSFGYPAGFDESSFKDFNKTAAMGLGLSLGIEYLVYNDALNDGISNNNLNYNWKIGVSLMDLGANSFTPSRNASQFIGPDPNISDASVEQKFTGAKDITALRDSIATLFTNTAALTDKYNISNPTRLIINVDKNLGNNFYVNGELSMNFFSTSSFTKLNTRELNLLTVTPRWETISWGAYLPVQYNTQGQFWVGLAVKAGPLVLGFHNLGLLKKDPMLNGGGYLLLSIHPFNKKKILSKFDCRN
jgi:hypothetical protein